MVWHIRLEMPSDAAAIHALTAEAFRQAIHTDHREQFVVDALREAGVLALSLVAEQGGSLVGHVALSPISISDGSLHWYGFGPISVSPEWQRRGIGSDLMHEALRRLRAQGAAGCVLLGDPAYYARFGFKAESDLVLPEVPPEYFQALAFGGVLPRGVVVYHKAFAAQ